MLQKNNLGLSKTFTHDGGKKLKISFKILELQKYSHIAQSYTKTVSLKDLPEELKRS